MKNIKTRVTKTVSATSNACQIKLYFVLHNMSNQSYIDLWYMFAWGLGAWYIYEDHGMSMEGGSSLQYTLAVA